MTSKQSPWPDPIDVVFKEFNVRRTIPGEGAEILCGLWNGRTYGWFGEVEKNVWGISQAGVDEGVRRGHIILATPIQSVRPRDHGPDTDPEDVPSLDQDRQ